MKIRISIGLMLVVGMAIAACTTSGADQQPLALDVMVLVKYDLGPQFDYLEPDGRVSGYVSLDRVTGAYADPDAARGEIESFGWVAAYARGFQADLYLADGMPIGVTTTATQYDTVAGASSGLEKAHADTLMSQGGDLAKNQRVSVEEFDVSSIGEAGFGTIETIRSDQSPGVVFFLTSIAFQRQGIVGTVSLLSTTPADLNETARELAVTLDSRIDLVV